MRVYNQTQSAPFVNQTLMMSLSGLPDPRKRLPTPIGGDNWLKRHHLNDDLLNNSVGEKESEQPFVFGNAPLPCSQQPGTVELKIEADFILTFSGSYSALQSTFNSLLMMKDCLSSTNLKQSDPISDYNKSCS